MSQFTKMSDPLPEIKAKVLRDAALREAAKNYLHDSQITKFNKDRSKVLSCGHGWPCSCSGNALKEALAAVDKLKEKGK